MGPFGPTLGLFCYFGDLVGTSANYIRVATAPKNTSTSTQLCPNVLKHRKKFKTKFSCDTLYVTFARVSEGGGYTLRLHAEDGGTLPREATLTYWKHPSFPRAQIWVTYFSTWKIYILSWEICISPWEKRWSIYQYIVPFMTFQYIVIGLVFSNTVTDWNHPSLPGAQIYFFLMLFAQFQNRPYFFFSM